MITYTEARNLSIRKWRWIVDNWDYTLSNDENITRLLQAIPELACFKTHCGWCEYNHHRICYYCRFCYYCALSKISNEKACLNWFHVFDNEEYSKEVRQENAIKILNACKAIPKVEDETDKP